MQLWPARSCGVRGWRITLEVLGRADDRHSHLRSDPDGDHILGDLFAHADAGIVSLRDDVRQPVVDDDLDSDIGIVGKEFPERRLQHADRRVLAGRYPQGPRRLVAQFAQRGYLVLNFLQARGDGSQQPLTGFRAGHASRGAGQQPQAEPFLEVADCLAQRRRRHAQFGGGAGEALLAGNRREGGKVV